MSCHVMRIQKGYRYHSRFASSLVNIASVTVGCWQQSLTVQTRFTHIVPGPFNSTLSDSCEQSKVLPQVTAWLSIGGSSQQSFVLQVEVEHTVVLFFPCVFFCSPEQSKLFPHVGFVLAPACKSIAWKVNKTASHGRK